jgi:hypothetical protein
MRSVLTILAGACCASLALAQPATRTETTTVQFIRSSTVIGQSFVLGTENVGKVTEVVFNGDGCIEYLLVQDAEGFIAVPYSVVAFNPEQKTVVVQSTTVTVDKLRELRFTEGRFPNFADPTFTQRVQSVWGTSARGRTGTAPGRTGTAPGTTSPDRKGTDPANPDRPGSGTKQPDRSDRPADPKTAPPAKDRPGTTRPTDPGKEPPRKDEPKKDKKDPDKP